MTVVRQNILSTIMLKNVKLSYGSVRLHLEMSEICQAINSLINSRIQVFGIVSLLVGLKLK